MLTAQPFSVGVFMACAGVVFLLLGHRVFKVLVSLSFGAVGFVLGSTFGDTLSAQLILGGVCGAAMVAVAACYLRPAVAVLTAGWLALLALQICSQMKFDEIIAYALAVFGFVFAISMTYIMYDEIIAFVTSLEGAFLCVGAVVVFFSRSPMVWATLRQLLVSNAYFGLFLILAGTVTGFYYQLAELRHKETAGQV